jgi:hypothetical protein
MVSVFGSDIGLQKATVSFATWTSDEQNLPHLLPLIASTNSNKSQRSSPQNATDPAEHNAFGVKRNECARTHRNKATITDLHLPASRFSRR